MTKKPIRPTEPVNQSEDTEKEKLARLVLTIMLAANLTEKPITELAVEELAEYYQMVFLAEPHSKQADVRAKTSILKVDALTNIENEFRRRGLDPVDYALQVWK